MLAKHALAASFLLACRRAALSDPTTPGPVCPCWSGSWARPQEITGTRLQGRPRRMVGRLR